MLSQRRISVILTCSFLRKFGVRTHANPKQEKGLAKSWQGDPDHEKNSKYMATPQTCLSTLRAPPKRWQDLFYCGVSSVHAHPLLFFTLMVPPPGGPSEMSGGAGIQKVLVNNRGTKHFLVCTAEGWEVGQI